MIAERRRKANYAVNVKIIMPFRSRRAFRHPATYQRISADEIKYLRRICIDMTGPVGIIQLTAIPLLTGAPPWISQPTARARPCGNTRP